MYLVMIQKIMLDKNFQRLEITDHFMFDSKYLVNNPLYKFIIFLLCCDLSTIVQNNEYQLLYGFLYDVEFESVKIYIKYDNNDIFFIFL